MKTALCDTLKIEYPIIAAPMGPDLTGPDLVAAVSNAGGLGILQAQFHSPPHFRDLAFPAIRTLEIGLGDCGCYGYRNGPVDMVIE